MFIINVDPALPVAFRNVFANTTHLLCRWHIDRYAIAHAVYTQIVRYENNN